MNDDIYRTLVVANENIKIILSAVVSAIDLLILASAAYFYNIGSYEVAHIIIVVWIALSIGSILLCYYNYSTITERREKLMEFDAFKQSVQQEISELRSVADGDAALAPVWLFVFEEPLPARLAAKVN